MVILGLFPIGIPTWFDPSLSKIAPLYELTIRIV